jgi:transposase
VIGFTRRRVPGGRGKLPTRVQAVWKQREIAILTDSIGGESALESRGLGLWSLTMHRFIDGEDRMQQTLLPHSLEDYVSEENPVRVIEVFIDELDLAALGFAGMTPAATGRPAYHPSTLLKIYLYGYLNRVQSSRRLERETQRNIELMWLTGRLMPDFKTIADFRKDNGPAIRATCRQFVMLCRRLDLFPAIVIAIDGSRFKAVNTRDKNYTHRAIARRKEQIEVSIARDLSALDTADRQSSAASPLRRSPLRRGRRSSAPSRRGAHILATSAGPRSLRRATGGRGGGRRHKPPSPRCQASAGRPASTHFLGALAQVDPNNRDLHFLNPFLLCVGSSKPPGGGAGHSIT